MDKGEFTINNFLKKLITISLSLIVVFFYINNVKPVHATEVKKSFDYLCVASTSLAGDIEIKMNVTPTVSIPDFVQPNQEIPVTDMKTAIQVDLTGELAPLKAFINPFNGHVSQFQLQTVNQTVNAVGEEGAAIPETPFNEEDTFIPFQISGKDTNVTAGEESVDIHVGEIEAEIHAKLGSTPINLPVTCTPPSDSLLATVQVEEAADATDPEISIIGDNPMHLKIGEPYTELGATASDNVDGDITDQITITGNVNTDVAGEYTVTYSVADKAGNKTTATRTIFVKNTEEPGDGDKPGDGGQPDGDDPGDGEQPGGSNPNDGNKPGDDDPGDGNKPDDGDDDSGDENKPGGDELPGGNDPNDGKPGGGQQPDDGNGNPGGKIDNPKNDMQNNVLPNTATNTPFILLIGTLLLVLGGALYVTRKFVFN
ncbi:MULTISPECIES: DUF5011 domain-containing protein [Clostridia]|uniref:DUF5011 domain-containing protein n=1 Tax=Clostridia TaxID=186801 RepID=UPI000EA38DC6|nr:MULTISPECIES: DUF5011 domain-containing protein [Clostridia]NBJ69591.1 DUF5011 domain-containing protein [Roseburia sp. 1XD42-34]RKI78348.1 DUF5011 domain-containing protein [Clostridium sp. 1xD42-85]